MQCYGGPTKDFIVAVLVALATLSHARGTVLFLRAVLGWIGGVGQDRRGRARRSRPDRRTPD